MEGIEEMVKATLGEIEKLLSTKTVVGDPMTVEGNTLIPLVSIGFGFGAGQGYGPAEKSKESGMGGGGGAGGGGGVKPVAVIIVGKDGVTVAPIVGGAATAVEKIGEVVGKAIEKRGEKKKEE